MERLCRYTARPPLAIDRLELLHDGRVRYRFKRAWRNGTTHAIFEPLQLLERLAALVPIPRANLVRYHGVLAPAARWRPLVVPQGSSSTSGSESSAAAPNEASRIVAAAANGATEAASKPSAAVHGRNYAWAELMARVFNQPTNCIACNRNIRPRPDYTPVSSTLWPGNRFRRSTATMG